MPGNMHVNIPQPTPVKNSHTKNNSKLHDSSSDAKLCNTNMFEQFRWDDNLISKVHKHTVTQAQSYPERNKHTLSLTSTKQELQLHRKIFTTLSHRYTQLQVFSSCQTLVSSTVNTQPPKCKGNTYFMKTWLRQVYKRDLLLEKKKSQEWRDHLSSAVTAKQWGQEEEE